MLELLFDSPNFNRILELHKRNRIGSSQKVSEHWDDRVFVGWNNNTDVDFINSRMYFLYCLLYFSPIPLLQRMWRYFENSYTQRYTQFKQSHTLCSPCVAHPNAPIISIHIDYIRS